MSARGFTIFELLVVLAITALLAGIVLPIGVSRLAADRFRQTQSQLASAVIIARADAQRRGVMVRLVAVQDERGTALWGEDADSGERLTGDAGEEDDAPRRTFVLELPSGVVFEDLPVGEDESEEEPEEADRNGPGEEPEGQLVRVLCVLMPDGHVAPGREVLLVAGDRAARVQLNMWTGEVTFEPFVRVADDDDAPPATGAGPGETGGGA